MDVVAVSPDLTPEMVLDAYPRGLFPMAYVEGHLITWHRPRVRAIIPLEAPHVPRRLARTLAQGKFDVTFDTAFREVMEGCAFGRPVWISDEFHRVYGALHDRGVAHSVEVWQRGGSEMVGGLYGLAIGGAFFAESKFHRARDASKVAVVSLVRRLVERGFGLLEVQYLTDHLRQFGTIEVSHRVYMSRLASALDLPVRFGPPSPRRVRPVE
ncbi:MAG TPA: leucyl/phenylalanyl-tRNA--protein transferase [Vicinamibacteria bacterium]|nr:leucyl/phenylalanyl-tRNA--protein transferase [Vicinamibacteria bacterium]HRB13943.1 leucyl/phenylalanyl-tRNA--protein transferase [Vicinamibacteria bacterium]